MPDVGGIAGDRLRSLIERIERLEEERRTTADDIKEVYAEAKGAGFDTKIMRAPVMGGRDPAVDPGAAAIPARWRRREVVSDARGVAPGGARKLEEV